jgi:hypothetical protein
LLLQLLCQLLLLLWIRALLLLETARLQATPTASLKDCINAHACDGCGINECNMLNTQQ